MSDKTTGIIPANFPEGAQDVMDRIHELEVENGRCRASLHDALGLLAGDTCNMCNFLERGDCHNQKKELRRRLELMWSVINNPISDEFDLHRLRSSASTWFDTNGKAK